MSITELETLIWAWMEEHGWKPMELYDRILWKQYGLTLCIEDVLQYERLHG